jgi:hypothetical protein
MIILTIKVIASFFPTVGDEASPAIDGPFAMISGSLPSTVVVGTNAHADKHIALDLLWLGA